MPSVVSARRRAADGRAAAVTDPARGWRMAVLVAIVTLVVISVLTAQEAKVQLDERRAEQLATEAARIDEAIQVRVHAYVQVLRGGLGLFEASDEVTRDDWIRYVDTLQLDERFPGFKSLTWAPAVPDRELAAFVAGVRAQPVPAGMDDPSLLQEFELRSPTTPSDQDLHSPILYVAPWTPRNQLVLGVDMMQDATRRAALLQAAETGETVLTPRLVLASQGDQGAGFIAYAAVLGPDDVVRGWLTAAFVAEDFMDGLLGDQPSPVQFQIRAEAPDGLGALLYSTAGVQADGAPRPLAGSVALRSRLSLPGRLWTVDYAATDIVLSPQERHGPIIVLLVGLLITVLVAVLGRAGVRWRRQAHTLAVQGESLRRSEAAVRHQATHDALTGLANRALFVDRLEELASSRPPRPFALAYLDIDGFKAVNDAHGHVAGDELLRGIAGRLTSRLRATDLVARIGGDEFAVLLVDADEPPARAAEFCHDLVARLRQPFSLVVDEDRTITASISGSLGLARFPDHAGTADELLVAADLAMYRAKHDGGDHAMVLPDPTVVT